MAKEGVFAEQAGVDFFGIGEHHTDYFPMPAGDVVLAAIAARTERIRLGSAVTVLSSDEPVRVFHADVVTVQQTARPGQPFRILLFLGEDADVPGCEG